MSELNGPGTRTSVIYTGEIMGHFEAQLSDGPEARVVVNIHNGGEWEIPTSWFSEAGHTALDVGATVQVEGLKAHGMLLRRLQRVLPPVAEQINELGLGEE